MALPWLPPPTIQNGNWLPTIANDLNYLYSKASASVGTFLPVYYPETYGAVGDGSTDDSTAINNTIGAAASAGGGTVYFTPGKRYLCNECITVPYTYETVSGGANNGLSLPIQNPIRLTGGGGPSWDGYWTANPPQKGAILDLRYSGGDSAGHTAKIDTRGAGYLEIDHLTLVSGGTDVYGMIQTTNTTVFIHHNAFFGNSSYSGSACTQVAITLGGVDSGGSIGDTSTSCFQGYGTKIHDNWYGHIAIGTRFRQYANSCEVQNETFSITCGSSYTDSNSGDDCGAPYLFTGQAANGNRIIGGTIEMENQSTPAVGTYKAAVALINGNKFNYFAGVMGWDTNTSTSTGMVYCGNGCANNIIDDCYALDSSSTLGALPATFGPTWTAQYSDTGWNSISAAAGFTTVTQTYWRKIRNICYLTGTLKVPSTTGTLTVFTLPFSFAYAQTTTVPLLYNGAMYAINMTITTGGAVTIYLPSSMTNGDFSFGGGVPVD